MAVEELRKWTSKEAIGDETVAPDCVARVSHNTTIADTSVISLRATSMTATDDCTDSIIMITSNTMNTSRQSEEEKDTPLDHRLPSPEEQCQILASKYVEKNFTKNFNKVDLIFNLRFKQLDLIFNLRFKKLD